MTIKEIKVKGARQHNLRDVDLTLPRGEMICFSGVSGSGKSSLAFDTLYAEGQRRYVESLSNYARQFMGQMPKPDVDLVSGLSPSISISQKSTGRNPRSTVGTITEIYDFLRVLFARVGTGHCPQCGEEIRSQSRDAIVSKLADIDADQTLWLLAPVVRGQKGEFKDLFEDLRRQGFSSVRVDDETYKLSDPPMLDRSRRHHIEVVVDRVHPDRRDRGRLLESVETALRVGETTMMVSVTAAGDHAAAESKHDRLMSSRYACGSCGESFRPPSPQLFSFNSTQGMCPSCDGLGHLYTFVPELLIPNHRLSIRKGAIPLLGKWGDMGRYRRHIYKNVGEAMDRHFGLSKGSMLETKWEELPEEAQQVWLWGTDRSLEFTWRGGRGAKKKYSGSFEGIVPELLERYRTTKNKMQIAQLEKHMDTMPCVDCGGQRLNPQACAVTVQTSVKHWPLDDQDIVRMRRGTEAEPRRMSLPQVCALPIDRAAEFFSDLKLDDTQAFIAAEALKEIRSRLGFLLGVGLDYLTLSRTAPTLSGGESQRIRLAGQIGSGLVGVLYILDEPSIGLHPRDNDRLIATLGRLRDAGNTLIVVEHDEDTMRASDRIIDFGPGPGVRGGKVVGVGSVDDLAASKRSVTGAFLAGKREISVPETLRDVDLEHAITICGATHHNLKHVDATFPLRTLTCVTGVSGSGKSSLISGILQPALRVALMNAEDDIGDYEGMEGLEHLDKIIAIDQSPIGRTPRSNPATYVKVFDEIRNLFAQLPEAKTRGYTASRFSFNVDGGRCAACDGNGATKLEMDFLADLWVTCPVCQGHRYNRETLSVKFKGHSIADVLELDIAQALKLFENIPKVAVKLQTLVDVGLEYLKLGQPSPTLSGGEAQRIKLSRELSKRDTGRTMYVLDEPTTGLHFADIDLLLGVLHRLADRGNTVLVVEHNIDVIKTADWIIDLGPEGGAGGGTIVAAGRPEAIAKTSASYTGAALAKAIGVNRRAKKKIPTRNLAPISDRAKTHVVVRDAREHNLRSVDAELPRDAMTVFCGPSGSGKSSLAMDTIYAEGQRRYVESLSSYARQFIGQAQKPKVEQIEGLSPAVALEQKNLGHSPRSTVGTVTELYDYLRILMARLGQMHCPDCQIPVGTQTPDQIVDKVMSIGESKRALLLAPLDVGGGHAAKDTWASLRSQGFSRVRIDGRTIGLDEAGPLDVRKKQVVEVVVDRIVIRDTERSRIADSVEQALSVGVGVLRVAIADDDRPEERYEVQTHSQHLVCGSCGRSFEELTPHHFSFNSSVGWCEGCEGLGVQSGTNPAALWGDPKSSLVDGGSLLWPNVDRSMSTAMMIALSRHAGLDVDTAWGELAQRDRRLLLRGTGEDWIPVLASDYPDGDREAGGSDRPEFRFQFKGFYPALDEASRLLPGLRTRLEKFTDEIDCGSCDGSRLHDVASAVRFRDLTIGDLVSMPLEKLAEVVSTWKLDRREKKIAGELIREVESRTRFLLDVGLRYLTLHRGAATLSGGEAQRIRLAAQLGSGLCGVLYVLDEPTIGLHPRDNLRLLSALHRLRDQGNTLLVVEHDRDVIGGSDYLCDFGPRAGKLGGEIVARGQPTGVRPRESSVTAGYIDGTQAIAVPSNRRPVQTESGQTLVDFLTVHDCRHHNLKGVDFQLPLGVLTAITGPSGSGKSSLIDGILYPALARRLHRARLKPGRHESITGLRHIDKVIRVDQSPLGNSPSSNPATYTGLFDLVRGAFAALPEAQSRRFTARSFSFNVPGGRCESCEGSGQICIEMHFLPDVWVECQDCQGRRYNDTVLEVKLHGRSIADVLAMSCGEALELFADRKKISHILQVLCDVGLDYVTLGQPAPTLSGGEAQRVKLAAELARPDTGRTLYLLDEPTTGLHFDDIAKLLSVIQRLTDLGNTVVVIEHNMDVVKSADWIIDVGPEAGIDGGKIVFAGTPESLADTANKRNASATAGFVAEALGHPTKRKSGSTRPTSTKRRQRPSKASKSTAGPILKGNPNSVDPRRDRANHDRSDGVGSPWQALGRRWHTLAKGFDDQGQPDWPLSIAEQILTTLEQVAGEGSLKFDDPDRVTVHPADHETPWLEVETKDRESLKIHMKRIRIDAPEIEELPKRMRPKSEPVTLNLKTSTDANSRKLKAFLKKSFTRSDA